MTEPVSLIEAKQQLRVDGTAEDVLIGGHIVAAREWVEDYTGLILVRRTVTETFGNFARLQLRSWPIAAGTPVTIKYDDLAGAEQTISVARLMAGARPALIYPAAGITWPRPQLNRQAVRVSFEAGYADAAAVPAKLKAAMLVLIRGLYDDREMTEAVETSAKRLCRSFRIPRVG